MRFIPTLLFCLLTIGVGTLAVIQQTSGNLNFLFGTPPAEIGGKLYDFKPEQVGRIHILNNDGTNATIVKKGGAWMLNEPWKDYADARAVKALIDFAAQLQIEEIIPRDEVEELSEYGLRDDRIEIQLFDKGGAPLCHFNMGRYTMWRAFDPNMESEDPSTPIPSFPTLIIRPTEEGAKDYLYVCSDFADPAIRTIPIRDFFQGGLALFRDHRVFYNSPGFASEITLKEKNSEITLTRDGMGKNSEWRITKPFELATNPAALNQLLGGLATLQANQVLDPNAIPLPDPLPENIEHTISMRYFLPDGSSSAPVTAKFYPPETQDSPITSAIIAESEIKNRPAILQVPRGLGSVLANLPRNVNALRSRTMTSLQVRQVESVKITDFVGRSISLTKNLDPHERAKRWYSQNLEPTRDESSSQETYNGPANIFQINELFESLFKDEIEGFTDDASTDPKTYGLDQPIRRINIKLTNGKDANFVIGEKLRPQFFARRADRGQPLEISEEAYEAGLRGTPHREFDIVSRPPAAGSPATPSGLDLLGLDRPHVITINGVTIHLGRISSRHFYANQLDENGKHTPHVVEIQNTALAKAPLEGYRWRSVRLWNLNRFEIQRLVIQKEGEPELSLTHNFYNSKWTATQGAKDVTALLNTHKADILLKYLTDVEVHSWLGPISSEANYNLSRPKMKISVVIENIDDEGIEQGSIIRTLSIAEIAKGRANQLYYGKSSAERDFFLLDNATITRLSVDLLE